MVTGLLSPPGLPSPLEAPAVLFNISNFLKIAAVALISGVGQLAFAADSTAVPDPERVETAPKDSFRAMIVGSGDTYIAGQPTEAGLAWAKTAGVTTIINVRTPGEMANPAEVAFDEEAHAKALGLTYITVPLGGGGQYPYTPDALAVVTAAFENAKGKVLLHCRTGWRASHVWAATLVQQGVDPQVAVDKARKAAMPGNPFEDLLGGSVTYQTAPQTP